jgi:hypothetical protein
MPAMSLPRMLWILGVFFATFVATVAGYGPTDHPDKAVVVFIAVLASLPLLVGIHEVGHALGAVIVGYHVTGITILPTLDGWTSWEASPERESTARTTVFGLAGPVVTLLFAAGLLVASGAGGWLGAWCAGLGTFAALWTFDLLAPIPREGIPRDGWAISEMRKLDAGVRLVDRALLTGDAEEAHVRSYQLLVERGGELRPREWAAIAARFGLAHLALAEGVPVNEEAVTIVSAAGGYAPEDPVVSAVGEAFAARTGSGFDVPSPLRPPTGTEPALLALLETLRASAP